MPDLKEFERAFKKLAEKRKKEGKDMPSWNDTKELIRENNLFSKEEMKDSDLKNQLKQKATQIAGEVLSTDDKPKDVAATKPRKSPSKKRALDVVSDDDEEKPPQKKAKKAAPPPKKPKKQQKKVDSDSEAASDPPPKRSKVSKTAVSKPIIGSDDEKSESKSSLQPPESPEAADPKINEHTSRILAEAAALSDSALSVLEDGSPQKPRKTEGKKSKSKNEERAKDEKGKKAKPEKTSKDKGGAQEDSNEEEIKRLKSFIVACGVRKKWAKEFEGMEDKPKKQITHLKGILSDLGMTGRLSMEKAKAIKAKREFAEEIEEVVKFAARQGLPEERTHKSRGKHTSKKVQQDSEEEEEEILNSPRRPKKNLLAFLDDQSDEE